MGGGGVGRGILSAGVISELPLSGSANSSSFDVDGRPVAQIGQKPHGETWSASPGYFGALGVPLQRGRLFDHRDGPEARSRS